MASPPSRTTMTGLVRPERLRTSIKRRSSSSESSAIRICLREFTIHHHKGRTRRQQHKVGVDRRWHDLIGSWGGEKLKTGKRGGDPGGHYFVSCCKLKH